MRGNFYKDIEDGKKGEEVAYSLLKNSSQNKTVMDVRNDPYFQDLDIDFLAEKNSGIVIKYEVKTDRKAHETKNLVYEKTTSGNIGCLEKSHADYILYYLVETDKMYGFWLHDLKAFITRNNPKLYSMGDNATGYLLSIPSLIAEGILRPVVQ